MPLIEDISSIVSEQGLLLGEDVAEAKRDGDVALGLAAQLLGLGQGGLDTLVVEQRGDHVAVHGLAMGRVASQLTSRFVVTHGLGLLQRGGA